MRITQLSHVCDRQLLLFFSHYSFSYQTSAGSDDNSDFARGTLCHTSHASNSLSQNRKSCVHAKSDFDCSLGGIKVAAFRRHKSVPGRYVSQPLHDQLPVHCVGPYYRARVRIIAYRDQFFRELSVKTSASRSARNFRSSSLSTNDHAGGVRAPEKSRVLKSVGRACHSRRVERTSTVRTLLMHSALCGENRIGEIDETRNECN